MTRKLGQHFLINQKAVNKIIEVLNLQKGDLVIEIGPGHGELTAKLIEELIQVIAIEKDKKLVLDLRLMVKNKRISNLEIIEGDILKILPKLTDKIKSYKLVGNIPYYLTGYLLRVISKLKNKPLAIVLTLQKEVAERIVTQPPQMNLLAASVQFWAEPEIIMVLPPNSFKPEPGVSSAIVKFLTKKEKMESEERFYKILKILFRQPRKTILNNLADGLDIKKEAVGEKLNYLGIKEKERPQNLDLKTIKKIADVFLK